MEITNNFFDIFGLPEAYSINSDALSNRYRQLLRQFHPDRFANKPQRDRLRAVQWAATINQAFSTLKSPLKRAQYLLELQGLGGTNESTVNNDPGFLMEQMELREALAEVRSDSDPFAAVEALRDRIEREYADLQSEFAHHYDTKAYAKALEVVAKMQFFAKLLDEIELLEDALEDEY